MWACVGARRALAHTFGVRVRGRGGMGGYMGDETVANVYGLSPVTCAGPTQVCTSQQISWGEGDKNCRLSLGGRDPPIQVLSLALYTKG